MANIASGQHRHTKYLVNLRIIEDLLEFLGFLEDEKILEQVWLCPLIFLTFSRSMLCPT